MKQKLILIFLSGFYLLVNCQDTTLVKEKDFQDNFLSFLNDEDFKNASVSFYAVRLDTNETVAEYNKES